MKDYELAHFIDSSSGRLVTLDKVILRFLILLLIYLLLLLLPQVSGSVQWEVLLASPVVSLYQLERESIAAVPFTSVSQVSPFPILNDLYFVAR